MSVYFMLFLVCFFFPGSGSSISEEGINLKFNCISRYMITTCRDCIFPVLCEWGKNLFRKEKKETEINP